MHEDSNDQGDTQPPALPAVFDRRLSHLFLSSTGDRAVDRAVRRLVRDIDRPHEAISAFGSYVE